VTTLAGQALVSGATNFIAASRQRFYQVLIAP
jgi:hypothetical protein